MAKINKEEYEVLKGLDDKWKWIARDEAQQTYAYEYRPIKSKLRGQWESNWNDYYPLPHVWLQFIQWEDESPYNIAELIEGYEYWQRLAQNPTVANLVGYRNESEEIEVKNIEELKSWFEDDKLYVGEYVKHKIDQLDEPETVEQTTRLLENVLKENKRLGKLLEEKNEEWFELMDEINNQETLSEYWIEQKSIDTHVDTVNGEIQVTFRLDDLQNLLVPKQEEVDQAYKDGYEKGKQHATKKQSEETETVAGVLVDYLIASAKLKLALSMEIEELEE